MERKSSKNVNSDKYLYECTKCSRFKWKSLCKGEVHSVDPASLWRTTLEMNRKLNQENKDINTSHSLKLSLRYVCQNAAVHFSSHRTSFVLKVFRPFLLHLDLSS